MYSEQGLGPDELPDLPSEGFQPESSSTQNDFLFSITDDSFEEIQRSYVTDDIARRRLEEFDRACDLRSSLEAEAIAQSEEDHEFAYISDDSEGDRTDIQRRIDELNYQSNRQPKSHESSESLFSEEPLSYEAMHVDTYSETGEVECVDLQRDITSANVAGPPCETANTQSDNGSPTDTSISATSVTKCSPIPGPSTVINVNPVRAGIIDTPQLDSSHTPLADSGTCIIDELWTKFESVIAKQGRKVKSVRGDGFCLLHSISHALSSDHSIVVSKEHLQYIILAHIKHHGEKYSPFHFNSKEKVLADAKAFFETRAYNQEVVDLMVTIAADALFLDIYIYQENNSHIQLMKFSPSHATEKKIYLQFLYHPGCPLSNHYNAVVINHDANPTVDLTLGEANQDRLCNKSKNTDQINILDRDDFPALKDRLDKHIERRRLTSDRIKCHAKFSAMMSGKEENFIQEIEEAVRIGTEDCTVKEKEQQETIKELHRDSTEVISIENYNNDSKNRKEEMRTSTGSEVELKLETPPPAHSQPTRTMPDSFPIDLTMSNLDILASIASGSGDDNPSLYSSSHVQSEPMDLSTKLVNETPIDLTTIKLEPKVSSTQIGENRGTVEDPITISSSSESDGCTSNDMSERPSEDTSNATHQDMDVPGGNATSREDVSREIGMRKNDDFPISDFEGMVPSVVQKVPDDINGRKFYLIHVDQHEWHEAVTDRRHFVLNTCKVKSFNGVRRMGWCQGSWICDNKNCPFLKTSPDGQPNKGNWERGSTKLKKICYSCHTYARQQFCGARKLVEFSPEFKQVMVYHIGYHSCTLKAPSGIRRKRINAALQGKYGKVGPAEIQREEVRKRINEWDIHGAYEAANDFVDWRLVENEQERRVMEMFPDMNSFDAIAACKVQADKFDKYWIYRIIDSRHNISTDKTSDIIWKSSLPQVKLGLLIDKDSTQDNPLKNCPVYFDALHQRVLGFQSFALWILHPALKKVVRLASMELRTENTSDVQKFFEIWNECLQQVSGNPSYIFNPVRFICDEAGSNFRAILNVFGEEVAKTRVQACYWHYTRNAELKSKELPNELREDFLQICTEMATNPTVARYEECKATLLNLDEVTNVLGSWIRWWDARRSHVFAAFTGSGHSEANLAEVANAGWKRRAPMRLVDACLDDVCTSVAQEVNLRNFYQHAGFTAGKGPSQSQRARKERRKQMTRADNYINIIGDEEAMLQQAAQAENPHAFMPGGSSRHRPPKKRNDYSVQGEEIIGNMRRKRHRANVQPGPTLERQKFTALEILGEPVENFTAPLSTRSLPNHKDPPILALVGKLAVSRCQGCGRNITKRQIREEKDMVFKRKGVRGFMRDGVFRQYEGTLYYHLKMECILRKEPNMENKDITVTDEVFRQLSDTQLEHLADLGYLAYILANKM